MMKGGRVNGYSTGIAALISSVVAKDVEAPLIPHSALVAMPSENGGSACRRPP